MLSMHVGKLCLSFICACHFFVSVISAGCLQKHKREKRRLASVPGGRPVYRQTQVEQWVTGVVDTISGRVTFRADIQGRSGRTQSRQLVFIRQYTLEGSTLCTDEAKLYRSRRLAQYFRWHKTINHRVCVCVCVCVCVDVSFFLVYGHAQGHGTRARAHTHTHTHTHTCRKGSGWCGHGALLIARE
jgi:hypothetical protein